MALGAADMRSDVLVDQKSVPAPWSGLRNGIHCRDCEGGNQTESGRKQQTFH
jgi:hypothetical protein